MKMKGYQSGNLSGPAAIPPLLTLRSFSSKLRVSCKACDVTLSLEHGTQVAQPVTLESWEPRQAGSTGPSTPNMCFDMPVSDGAGEGEGGGAWW
ncbi:hypothetical protein AAFF_G00023390 [Aldrovandia affinis]|uniref:Uncharacterized protein n=1 Tax=Aldrovandia affinis TaxID=143900 RepID=A0AAD7T760_9TELE|nr:hypothetical protein AAFF_G00023390 [Aldrovandia affinis]